MKEMTEPTEREIKEAKIMAQFIVKDSVQGKTVKIRSDAIKMILAARNHKTELWRLVGALNELIPKYGSGPIPIVEADKTYQK